MSEPTERRNYDSISQDIKQFVHDELEAHEAREKMWIESLYDAFPERDIHGHRDYHESKIKAAKAEAEFWHAAKNEALKHGVAGFFAVLKWVTILTVLGFAYKIGLGPLVAKLFGAGV